MKRSCVILMIGVVIACGSAAVAETVGTHKVYLPRDIKWGPAPPSLPAGAEAAVLFGDPAKEGMFAVRIRAPKDYRIPPHTHSKPELLTVISGKFGLGMGPAADRAAVEFIAGWQLLVDARRRRPLRLRRRRVGHSDQRDRALGHRLRRPKERSSSERGAVEIAGLTGDASSPWSPKKTARRRTGAALERREWAGDRAKRKARP